ncbi:MAG: hypothetical protein RL112_342 [Planctomycetota bacterium]
MKNPVVLCALVALILVPTDLHALDRSATGGAPTGQSGADAAKEGGARAERREREGRRERERGRRRGPRRRGPIERLPAQERQAALELVQSARQAAAPLKEELRGLREEARRRAQDLGPGADAAARAALRADVGARAKELRDRHAPALADHGRRMVGLLPAEARARLVAKSQAMAQAKGVVWSEALLHERVGLRLGLGSNHARRGGAGPSRR